MTAFTFPAYSFRNIATPLESQGVRSYLCVVAVGKIPEQFKDWLAVNAREASLKGKVPKAIGTSLLENPEWFVTYNRGLTIVAEGISWDNQTKKVTVDLQDKDFHGVLDGGHTLAVILDQRNGGDDDTEDEAFCRIEVMTGVPTETIPDVVDARNTSRQVASKSLMNLEKKFDDLKSAIKPRNEALISWKENEEGQVDVREVIGILTAFDATHNDDTNHPIMSYSGKEQCLKHFESNPECYKKLYGIAPDLLLLWDKIQSVLPGQYNQPNRRFGGLKGCKVTKQPRPLPFIGEETGYEFPTGYLYPTVAAFRSMLEEHEGSYRWGKGLNPLDLVEDGLATKVFVGAVLNSIQTHHNPTKTGKDVNVWALAYRIVENSYLRA